MPSVTKTIGPLHLEDLEPHRFEDLVRQLLYDFRPWRDLEATGRTGSDGGFDARAWEMPVSSPAPEADDMEELPEENENRQWLIQCKREKRISPAKMKSYISELPSASEAQIYGIVFVAACDFSIRARDDFYQSTREKGFQEVKLWGKAEIEDQLFQPKNDHLLFGYFGFSLRVRQRSLKTEVRSNIATKKKATKFLKSFQNVLIRDASDDRYPYPGDGARLIDRRRWRVFRCEGCFHDGVHILIHRALAYLHDDKQQWDYLEGANEAHPSAFEDPWFDAEREQDQEAATGRRQAAFNKWQSFDGKNRAWLEVVRAIPYENILAIDEDGDDFFQGPHIYVGALDGIDLPFSKGHYEKVENCEQRSASITHLDESKRTIIFDRITPKEDDADK